MKNLVFLLISSVLIAAPTSFRVEGMMCGVACVNKIKAQAIDSDIMPPGNLTGMTKAERNKIKLWIDLGANINN